VQRKIVFKHSRAIGDTLMFTAGVRDFKLLFPDILINVDSNFPALWENNPYLDRSLKKGDDGVEFYQVGYPIINNSNHAAMSFTQGFLLDMISVADGHESLGMSLGEFTAAFANGACGDPDLGEPDKNAESREPFIALKKKYSGFCQSFARQRGDIHLHPFEKKLNLVKESYGYDKYWLVAPGGKSDCTCKIWDWRRFQTVVDHFEGMIKFVIIGKSDHIVEKLNGVIDLTDKFNSDIRGLIPLAYHAEGCVSGISFLLHLAATMPSRINKERKPCVGIYGGREPTNFTAYTNHQILHTNGAFKCCDNGGCWKSRVVPLGKSPTRNKNLCLLPVKVDGRTIPSCMDSITAEDLIRAISKYYDGNIYTYTNPVSRPKKTLPVVIELKPGPKNEINVLASLQSKGGGEQSACQIVTLLRKSGMKVNFHPWDKVHEDHRDKFVSPHSFKNGMEKSMVRGVPLLFYANDQIGDFVDNAESIVNLSSGVAIGINYVNSKLPKATWLSKSGKLKAVIFQNTEKRDEFERDRIGFEDTEQIVMFGAIDLDKYLEVCPLQREDEPFVILKHCTADWRKYVTEESSRAGEKIHLWQKNIYKEPDVKFYTRLLKDTKNTRFEFMVAHEELVKFFTGEPRMVFHGWNTMGVGEFLSRGHMYLYRTSNAWRDQYPRVVAEALAAGLPVLSEPRDGTKDRMDHGNIGLSCIDYDAFLAGIKLLQRKEKYRYQMGLQAKDWARKNLDPRKWCDVIERVFNGNACE